ncbi:MAG: hypothetical protein J4G18_14375 [Anaerolineae bacterium]|nr:hypothetical protein [Anaerolineae bacterium]
MQTDSPHKSKATELERIVDSWERRHEWRLLSRTVPRSLIAALFLSLIVGAVGYFRLRLQAEQLALISAGLCAAGGVLNLPACPSGPLISTSNSACRNRFLPPLS